MRFFFLLFIGLIFSSCSSQSDCEKFKTGRFKLDDPTSGFESIIERNDSIQIERNITMNTVSKYYITWKSPCEYALEMISGSDKLMEVPKNRTLNVKIISTKADQYTFEAWIEGIDHISTQTVKKIK